MLPKQNGPPYLDLGLDDDLPLVNLLAAVHASADRDEALSRLIPAGIVHVAHHA
jgi:hypothetical protein